jgi:hypothetical protein
MQLQWSESGVSLIIEKKTLRFRATVDPTVLIAVISVVSTGLGALIGGLLNIFKQRQIRKIVIRDKHGRTIEIPAGFDKDKIDELIEKLKSLESHQFEII